MAPEDRNTLNYECPHCRQRVTVAKDLLGEKVECPNCNRPFVAEAPVARPVSDGPSGGQAAGGRRVTGPAHDERVEQVIHPVVFRRHLVGLLLWILVIAGGLFLLVGEASLGLPPMVGTVVALGGIALALGFILKWFIESRVVSLTLTNERIIYRTGLITRRTSEVRHADVRNIRINRNLFERLLGFGDMSVSSAGQDDMEIEIHDVPDPESIAQFIRDRQ